LSLVGASLCLIPLGPIAGVGMVWAREKLALSSRQAEEPVEVTGAGASSYPPITEKCNSTLSETNGRAKCHTQVIAGSIVEVDFVAHI